eukprot:2682513-Prymnesium_polylepis.1
MHSPAKGSGHVLPGFQYCGSGTMNLSMHWYQRFLLFIGVDPRQTGIGHVAGTWQNFVGHG